MRVLVLGGTGFVGRHTAAALRSRGHTVIIGTRDPKRALAKLPPLLRDCDLREIHLESLTTRYVWRPLLRDVSAVVNAAGILRESGGETYDRVHHMAPAALALACERMGVRLVHLSVLGLRRESRNPFLRSKLLGERVITETQANYSLVRSSLLDGADGCAAAWLRRIAAWPIHVYPSDAKGCMAPMDVRDLADALAKLCEMPGYAMPREIDLGGSARRTLAEYLDALRALHSDRPALQLAAARPAGPHRGRPVRPAAPVAALGQRPGAAAARQRAAREPAAGPDRKGAGARWTRPARAAPRMRAGPNFRRPDPRTSPLGAGRAWSAAPSGARPVRRPTGAGP